VRALSIAMSCSPTSSHAAPFALILARMECDWANYNSVIAAISAIKDRNQQMAAAVAQGFPARISLVSNVSTMMFDLMATASTPKALVSFLVVASSRIPLICNNRIIRVSCRYYFQCTNAVYA